MDIKLSLEIHVITEVMAPAAVPVDEIIGVVRGHVAVGTGEHHLHPSHHFAFLLSTDCSIETPTCARS